MDIETVAVDNPSEMNFIFGQSHFIKTVEDVYEAMVNTVPNAKFGVAFCEASVDRLVRYEGTDDDMIRLARENALKVGAGHTFFVFMKDMFPINVLGRIKQVPEVCHIFCATANPTIIVVGVEGEQRGVLGVLDGMSPLGVEDEDTRVCRRQFLKKIGYKK